jgi:hypothetical protein
MVELSAISSALSSLSVANDTVGEMVGMSDITVIQSKLIELQFKLKRMKDDVSSAQAERTELLERIRLLEIELADLKAKENKKHQLKSKESIRG